MSETHNKKVMRKTYAPLLTEDYKGKKISIGFSPASHSLCLAVNNRIIEPFGISPNCQHPAQLLEEQLSVLKTVIDTVCQTEEES